MIASSVSGLRWLAVLLVATASIALWCAWPVVDGTADDAVAHAPASDHADERPVTYRYVPLMGLPLEYAVDDVDGDWDDPPREAPPGPVQTCLPFLAPILQHPNWQLRITSGFPSCYESVVTREFTIASSGEVTWTERGGPVRHLSLSEEQLALVRRLHQLSCVELKRTPDEQRYGGERRWLSIGLDLGKYGPDDGAYVPAASVLGRALTALFDDLEARYRGPRREVIGSMDLRLVTTERGRGAPYRVRIVGDRLTVKRGGNLLLDQELDVDLRLDLVDAALERRAIDKPSVKGKLLMDGWSVPVTLARSETGPFAWVNQAIDTARRVESDLRAFGMRSILE